MEEKDNRIPHFMLLTVKRFKREHFFRESVSQKIKHEEVLVVERCPARRTFSALYQSI